MKILIDLLGAQTAGSRNRGIGRYSTALAKEIVRIGPQRGHDVHILLNASFGESVIDVRAALAGLLPPANIHVWQPPAGAIMATADADYIKAAERIRLSLLTCLAPDAVLVTSLFEGFGDEAICSLDNAGNWISAVVLYDLIPYIRSQVYLKDETARRFYYKRIQQFKAANLFFAISESAAREAIDYLDVAESAVVPISTAADPQFRPLDVVPRLVADVRERYGLASRFVMYTGGIDYRKNVEGLIRAYASLPSSIRRDTCLAIVCAATPDQLERLELLGIEYGLSKDDLRLTGFVPEDDLVILYNLCHVFVFPSLHEGFGLPALEALACGAAVIGSNCSSIPEVIGDEDALFDPNKVTDIALKLERVLADEAFRRQLKARASRQAAKFSWTTIAGRALDALEAHPRPAPAAKASSAASAGPDGRPRLAIVSPLPPQPTGIARYMAELAPELGRYYDITFVNRSETSGVYEFSGIGSVLSPEDFAKEAHRYDRILYQIGNSSFHTWMIDLLAQYGGTVTLHETNLSGLFYWREREEGTANYWNGTVREQHGYLAASHVIEAARASELDAAQADFPVSLDAVRYASRIIVHSDYARSQLVQQHGDWIGGLIEVVPLLRRKPPPQDRKRVRKRLGLADDDFLVCTFGHVHPTKMHDVLLEAWFDSRLARDRRCRLWIVGGTDPSEFCQRVEDTIETNDGGERVSVLGYTSDERYAEILSVADMAIQLRKTSRGETSAALMDCLVCGVPLILSTGGSFAEVPDTVAVKLPSTFGAGHLRGVVERLFDDEAERHALSARAAAFMRETARPSTIAARYRAIIEAPGRHGIGVREALLRNLKTLDPKVMHERAPQLARAIAYTIPVPSVRPRLLVDTSFLDLDSRLDVTRLMPDIVRGLFADGIPGHAAEALTVRNDLAILSRARAFALVGKPSLGLDQPDDVFAAQNGDVCLSFLLPGTDNAGSLRVFAEMRVRGVSIVTFCTDGMLDLADLRYDGLHSVLARTAIYSDVVLVDSAAGARRLLALLNEVHSDRVDALTVLDAASLNRSTHRVAALSPQDLAELFARVHQQAVARTSGVARWIPNERIVLRPDNELLVKLSGELKGDKFHIHRRHGICIHGPYLKLHAGKYRVIVRADVNQPADSSVDACIDCGHTILARQFLKDLNARDGSISLDVMMPPRASLEIRVHAVAESDIVLNSYEIVRASALMPSSHHVV